MYITYTLSLSCYGGRNRKVSEAYVRTGKSFDELEVEMLNGQKLQGPMTAKEVRFFLLSPGIFPKLYHNLQCSRHLLLLPCVHVCPKISNQLCPQVYNVLKNKDILADYPVFTSVYEICFQGKAPQYLIQVLSEAKV